MAGIYMDILSSIYQGDYKGTNDVPVSADTVEGHFSELFWYVQIIVDMKNILVAFLIIVF